MQSKSWKIFNKLVIPEQAVFGLPWLVTSALLPIAFYSKAAEFDKGNSISVVYNNLLNKNFVDWMWIFFLMIIAFASGRTAGMAWNRWTDRKIDAANPRTMNRSLPKGEISNHAVFLIAIVSIVIFFAACASINKICLMLSPVAAFLFWGYSYTKRFTSLCHFILGLIHCLIAIFAWAAITDELAWPPVILGLAAMVSIASNDIVYALQDMEFDRHYGLYSVPVKLGLNNSLWLSRGLHLLAVLLLSLLGILLNLTWIYFVGVSFIGIIYVYFHKMINFDVDKQLQLNKSFFMCNSVVGLTLMIFTIIDLFKSN